MPVVLSLIPEPHLRTFARIPGWRLIQRAADRVVNNVRTLWRTLLGDMQEAVPVEAVETALERGQLFAVEAALAPLWEREVEAPIRRLLPAVLTPVLQEVAMALQSRVAVALGVEAAALTLPASLPWVEQYTGAQIVAITDTTRLAIRQLVREALSTGTSSGDLAQRIKAQIGLTPRQMQTVERLRQRLAAEGKPGREIARQLKRASQKALNARALNIARTESMAAANAGQQELWRHAARGGFMRPGDWERQWLTAQDERTCPICRPMNGQRRGLEEPFLAPGGEMVLFPPVHPACRCTITLVAASSQEAA